MEGEERKQEELADEGRDGREESFKRGGKVMHRLGVEVKIEDIRKIEAGRQDKGEMAVVKVGSEEERRKVLRNK